MQTAILVIVLAPLLGAIVAGLFGRQVGRAGAHWITILGVGASFVLSAWMFYGVALKGVEPFEWSLYRWATVGTLDLEVGFLIDKLTVTMMAVVTFVSLMVHIYTIGYMQDDPGYQRFFAYIALFTFSMLMLVMSNNFMQLYFGWEAVGLVSYLLIGFWYTRPTAIYANLKAFLVNRVGDFGFLLGIAVLLMYAGSLNYQDVFADAQELAGQRIGIIAGQEWMLPTVICLLLFVGAMGKSAQMPLHVWLPDSMEGPTPISALIHAATMVTAGIFMVARMSPLFEHSDTALNVVLVVGALTAFLMGLVGLVQNDIKRVVAYSTLSQLGYMTVALGASAYSVAIFHLMTHAFFKALLFLGAGSVIIALHHEQDIRRMGGLRRYMPITWITSLVGSLALIGFPGMSGFYSKDAIIEAVHNSTLPAAHWAYLAVLSGVFVTALYSFRMFFLVFHGKSRLESHVTHDHQARGAGHAGGALGHGESHAGHEHGHAGPPRESPAVVTVPLILLAIPSILAGAIAARAILKDGFFGGSIIVHADHGAARVLAEEFHDWQAAVIHGLTATPTLLAAAGLATAWVLYLLWPSVPAVLARVFAWPRLVLERKYGFDELNEFLFGGGARGTGDLLSRVGDAVVIDGVGVNGTARLVGWISGKLRWLQSGYLYHYAFAMIIGVLVLLGYFVHGVGR
ncbi:MAG: NADH-quinone oxidoreductase subunit L [Gammaproteobacteria bacterium]|nr:NADH-quinone oxidoreductase subunit L [Gammaproteobacteria bacterium]